MKILRLAELLILKYADISPKILKDNIKKDINILWSYIEKFNILRACAEAAPKNPSNSNEVKAVEGFKFCQQLLSMIDYLQANKETIALSELKKVLFLITNLIKDNTYVKFDTKGRIAEEGEFSDRQFPHVSELIFEIIPATTKHARTQRDQQFAKARAGLSRILSFSLSMLEKLSKLEMMIPDEFDESKITEKLPNRFSPQRALLSIYDIIDFIRQHGDEYGISSLEDWSTIFRDDPQLKEEMTTIVNSINRGHYPKNNVEAIKENIVKILKDHERRKITNEPYLEQI